MHAISRHTCADLRQRKTFGDKVGAPVRVVHRLRRPRRYPVIDLREPTTYHPSTVATHSRIPRFGDVKRCVPNGGYPVIEWRSEARADDLVNGKEIPTGESKCFVR